MDNLCLLEDKAAKNNISILPIPLDIGSDNHGMDLAPEYLLKHGLKNALTTAGFNVKVLPEIIASKEKLWRGKSNNQDIFGAILKIATATGQQVKQEIKSGNKVLALGGDHAISIGTIAGAAEAIGPNLGLIWIDAHADINTEETSLSESVHGMVSSTLLGIGSPRLTNLVKIKIKPENILYIGLKDLDQAEIDLIRKHKLSALTMFDILQNGFASIIEQVQALQKRTKQIWITMDVDSLDEEYAPAAAMATLGGLTYREITNLMTYIGKTSNVIGGDIVELTPEKDINGKTGKLCIELAAAMFGSQYTWYSEYMKHHNKK